MPLWAYRLAGSPGSITMKVVLVAGAAPFPGSGVARICAPDNLNIVVTNQDADPTTCAALCEAGVEVLTG